MLQHAPTRLAPVLLLTLGVFAAACVAKPAPVTQPTSPVPAATAAPPVAEPPSPIAPPVTTRSSAPTVQIEPAAPALPVPDDTISAASASLDTLNRDSPLRPVFFELDSAEVGKEAQAVLDGNAALLKANPTWAVTIEGHCDERGTAEYNLALGQRRAVAARAYLVSLGIAATRLATVSYGKEFPFDPGHEEAALAKNRRAHFVITAK